MIFTSKNILIISPETWSNAFVSKHHYALELAKRYNKVYFLNPPISNIEKKFELRSDSSNQNLFIVDYKPIRGLRFLPLFIANFIEKSFIKRLQKACSTQFDIIWNFETSRFYNFVVWDENVLKILHIVDLNRDFQTRQAASTADICFVTTDFIKERLIKFNKLTFKIHHGYTPSNHNIKIEEKTTNIIRAGYVGVLSIKYLDWRIISILAKSYPQVNFDLIGPLDLKQIDAEAREHINALTLCNNVKSWGAVPADEIGAYLASMDILLVTYKVNEYREQLASPHKIMDYLGSGKVIVATYTDEYKDKDDLLFMSETNEQFLNNFNTTLSNLSYFNSPALQEKRKAFANDNTYAKQLDRIEKLILDNKLH